MPASAARRSWPAPGKLRATPVLDASQKEAPKCAWWRGLFSWETGPQEKTQGCSQTPTTVPASNHLKWARHVSSVQREWLREQHSVRYCTPSSNSRCGSAEPGAGSSSSSCPGQGKDKNHWPPKLQKPSKPRPSTTKYGAAFCFPLEVDARAWVQALREEESLDPGAADWQESKSRRIRRDQALVRLQAAQAKWRQQQTERERLRSYSSQLEYAEGDTAEEEEEDCPHGVETTIPASLSEPPPHPFANDARLPALPFPDDGGLSPPRSPSRSRMASRQGSADLPASSQASEPEAQVATASRISSLSSSDESGQIKAITSSAKREGWKHSASNSRTGSLAGSSSGEDLTSSAQSGRISLMSSLNIPDRAVRLDDEDDHVSDGGFSRNMSARDSPELRYEETGPASTIIEEIEEPHINEGPSPLNFTTIKAAGVFRRATQRRAGALELWEDWRTEFSMGTLDTLTDYFESLSITTADYFGCAQTTSLHALIQAITQLLRAPEQVVCEQAVACGLLPAIPSEQIADPPDCSVTFASLSHFLTFARSVAHCVEKEHTWLLWSSEGQRHITETFKRYANAIGRLAMSMMFEVIEQLDFPELQVKDPESQQWVADCTKSTLEGRRVPNHEKGTISIDELCRIITAAMREKKRRKRRIDFKHEWKAVEDTGFSPVEMEDLRELHHVYAAMELSNEKSGTAFKDPLPRMTMLLHGCIHEGHLGQADIEKLKTVVRSTSPERLLRVEGDGVAPFDVFLLWMKEILQLGLGSLQWTCSGTAKPTLEMLSDQQGFTAAMFRELARSGPERRALQQAASHLDELSDLGAAYEPRHNSEDAQRSAVADKSNSRRRSSRMPDSSSSGAARSGHHHSSSSTPSSSRRSSAAQTNSAPHKARHGSLTNRQNHTGSPRRTSDSSRRSSKRTEDRSKPRSSLPKTSQPDAQSSCDVVIISKNLPPSEAMLNHKQFRANSVDLTDQLPLPSDQLQGTRMQQPKEQRRVKPAQDSMLIVTDVIARLEEQAAAGEEPEPSVL